MKNWASSTGLATVAVDADGKYISDCYNFTEFCIDLTRGSVEGKKRCEQCDREGHGVYPCHAGLVDFHQVTLSDGASIDLGGIAKGYTSSRVIQIMKDCGIEHAIVNLGGNVQVLGRKS